MVKLTYRSIVSEKKDTLISKYPDLKLFFKKFEMCVQANPYCGKDEFFIIKNEVVPVKRYEITTNLFSPRYAIGGKNDILEIQYLYDQVKDHVKVIRIFFC
jgi:hypothetical protein